MTTEHIISLQDKFNFPKEVPSYTIKEGLLYYYNRA